MRVYNRDEDKQLSITGHGHGHVGVLQVLVTNAHGRVRAIITRSHAPPRMKTMDVDFGGFLTQNMTFDYPEDYVYEGDVESKRSGTLSVLIPVLYAVVLVVGLLGNALLLFVLAKRWRHWRISDIFILNLSIADVLLLGTLPFWAVQAAQEAGWCFGTAFCKICGAIFNINFYCGIFLLVCISLDRDLFIVHSLQLYFPNKPMLAWASCLSVWFVSLLLTIPDWIFLEAGKDTTQALTLCVHTYTTSVREWQLWPRMLHHIVGLLLPSVALIICWSCIIVRLHCSTEEPQQHRAVSVLPLVGVFFICWIPYNITLVVDTYRNSLKESHPSLSEASLTSALTVTSALACMHSCLRPVLYLLFNENFRRRTLAVLRCETTVEPKSEVQNSLWELGVGQEALLGQRHELEKLKQKPAAEQQMPSV